jgi:hypothetical protein
MFTYLTPDQVTLIRIAIVSVLILAFVLMALVSVLGSGIKPRPVPPMHVLPATDDTTVECPRCGGAGVTDWFLDDWGRDVLHDVDCPACNGTGSIQAVF